MFRVYSFVADYVGEKLGRETELTVGRSFRRRRGRHRVLCGLPYVELAHLSQRPVDLLAAPVLTGERCAGRPIYFSDVIVRANSPFRSFSDLRGGVTTQTRTPATTLPATNW